jgi:uncharacterized protein (DUF1786 family)
MTMPSAITSATFPQAAAPVDECKMCTIRLETLCYQRAWWFRAFRETLASGVRLFAFLYRVQPQGHKTRSAMCDRCFRFQKNEIKARSGLFRWLDGYVNPLFNRVRDSLLTPEEMARMRELARRAADRNFRES